jgi:homoserine/homoserine lactone efflux protein
MSLEIFLLYLATWALVAVTPGPAVMCAMSMATRYGWRHALAGIAGIQLGHFVFFGCVASGLAALLGTATTAFTVLRIAGAIYLVYLGVRAIMASFGERKGETEAATLPARRSLFLQGFAIQVTNPKALLFMSALLPQFIRPEAPLGWQLAVLLGTTVLVDVLVLGGYAAFARRGAQALRASRFTAWLERAFGAALIAFGLRLLATRK